MGFIGRWLDKYRAWREYKRETEMLTSIYDMTNGHYDGINFARKKQAKGIQLQSFTQGRTGRITVTSSLVNLLPIPSLMRSAIRSNSVFGHMARSAWAISQFLGHAPTFWRDAAYDLLAITTLWARRKRIGKALDEFTAKAEAEGTGEHLFGKALLILLLERGVSNIRKSEIERMYASNPLKNMVKKQLKPLTDEMRHVALTGVGIDADMFDSFWADYVPIVGRAVGAGKDARKIHTFQAVAVEYYTAKQKVETIHGRPSEP